MDTELLELRTQRADLINKANRALEEDKTEDANGYIAKIKELDERISKVEKDVDDIKKEDGEENKQAENMENKEEQRNMNPAFAVQPGNQTK